jgi:hypothetical protein
MGVEKASLTAPNRIIAERTLLSSTPFPEAFVRCIIEGVSCGAFSTSHDPTEGWLPHTRMSDPEGKSVVREILRKRFVLDMIENNFQADVKERTKGESIQMSQ